MYKVSLQYEFSHGLSGVMGRAGGGYRTGSSIPSHFLEASVAEDLKLDLTMLVSFTIRSNNIRSNNLLFSSCSFLRCMGGADLGQ